MEREDVVLCILSIRQLWQDPKYHDGKTGANFFLRGRGVERRGTIFSKEGLKERCSSGSTSSFLPVG